MDRQINWRYLIPLVSTLTFGCANIGFVITGNNQVGGILSEKMNWGESETTNNTAISSASISGLLVGSFAIGPILQVIGRRNSIMLTSFMCIISVIPTVFLNLTSILIGRFALGLSAGGLIVASSIYLNETVPVEHSYKFGFTINFGAICGVMLCLAMGAALPDPKKSPAEADANTFWIFINMFAAIIGAVNLVLWLFVFKHESVKACLYMNQSEDGR